jgi:hypothetical protein
MSAYIRSRNIYITHDIVRCGEHLFGQKKGSAMGTAAASVIAILFLDNMITQTLGICNDMTTYLIKSSFFLPKPPVL